MKTAQRALAFLICFGVTAPVGSAWAGPSPQKKEIPEITGIDGTKTFSEIQAEIEQKWGGKYMAVQEVSNENAANIVVLGQQPLHMNGDELTDGQYMHFMLQGSGVDDDGSVVVPGLSILAALLAALSVYFYMKLRDTRLKLEKAQSSSDDEDDD